MKQEIPNYIKKVISNSDCYQPSKDEDKAVLTLELWRDGSAKAFYNNILLSNFIKMADKSGRNKVVKMLREAAMVIEEGVI